MGFFSGGSDIEKRKELGSKLYPHERWCSRCYLMDGSCTNGFYCREHHAQSIYLKEDGTMGSTREDVQRPLCEGEYFASWSLDDPYAETYMINY